MNKWRQFASEFCDEDHVRLEEYVVQNNDPTAPFGTSAAPPPGVLVQTSATATKKWHTSLAEKARTSKIRLQDRLTPQEKAAKLAEQRERNLEFQRQEQLRHELQEQEKEEKVRVWEEKLAQERSAREVRRAKLMRKIERQKAEIAEYELLNGPVKKPHWGAAIPRPKPKAMKRGVQTPPSPKSPRSPMGQDGDTFFNLTAVPEAEQDKRQRGNKIKDGLPPEARGKIRAQAAKGAGGKVRAFESHPQIDNGLREMFPGLDRTTEGRAIKNAAAPGESLMPKKQKLRKAQHKILNKMASTVNHYRQQVKSQLDRILALSELEYGDEEGRTRERMKPSLSRMMVQLKNVKQWRGANKKFLKESVPQSLLPSGS